MSGPAFNLPIVEALVAHYATLQGLTGAGWVFAVEIVPGLIHNGEPAWATVVSDPASKTASIKVRDLASTPIAGVDDPWTELKVTISHELWHPWVTALLANPSEAMEEALVEAAAQAVVRSAGADAQVMARSIRAIPGAVRARVVKISARAGLRARGETMDESQVQGALEALETGDAEKAKEILKAIVAALAVKGAGGAAVEPDGDEVTAPDARGDNMADPTKPAGAPPAPRAMPRAVDQETRARKAADALNKSAIRARIHELRTVDGVNLPPALEQLILAERDIDGAEKLLRVAALAKGDGTRARAETGAKPPGTPPPAPPSKYKEADLLAEGIHPLMAKAIAEETDAAAADVAYKAARARKVASTSPWPTKGGAA